MATNNPNVPADQEAAAKNSAPNAKVVDQQPVQQNGQVDSVDAVTAGQPVKATVEGDTGEAPKRSKKAVDSKDDADDLKTQRDEEQKTLKDLEKKNKDADYFEKVANDDAVFNDPYREQARQERLAQEAASKGDPTRDPVAKQAAMDMNTPEPGAQEEAAKMRSGK